VTQSGFEKTGEQISDTIHKASRAASAAAEAIEDGVRAAKRTAKQGSYAAVEFLDDAKRGVQRNPFQAVLAAFAAGIGTCAAVSWMMKRKRCCDHCNKSDTRGVV